jgi:hypothetical protein
VIAYSIVFVMATAIAPGAEKTQDAKPVMQAIAATATNNHDAALLLIVAWRESRFKNGVIGDGGLALGPWQSHNAPRAVLWNLPLAAKVALARIRYGETVCPQFPLAVYASGNCKKGHAVSDARMKEVKRLEDAVDIVRER